MAPGKFPMILLVGKCGGRDRTSPNQVKTLTTSDEYVLGIFRMVDYQDRQHHSKPSGKGVGVLLSP